MTELIHVDLDSSPLLRRFQDSPRRLAYATVNAIRDTLLMIQQAERKHVEAVVHVRNRTFTLRQAAVIDPFPSVKQGRAFGEIAVGRKPRLLLGNLEAGGARPTPRDRFGMGGVTAVPITGGAARPDIAQPLQLGLTFKGMRLAAHTTNGRGHSELGGRVQYKGRNRTFLLMPANHQLGEVLERVGPKRGDVRLAWKFTQGAQLQPILHFVEIAKQTAHVWFSEYLEQQTLEALNHDRFRSVS